MRTTKALAIALALLPVIAAAQSKAAVAYIAGTHRNMEKASMAGDYKAVEKVILGNFLSTFRMVGPDKKSQTRGDLLAMIKKEMDSGGELQSFKFTLGKMSKKAGKVVVPGSLRIKGRGPGEDGKQHTFESAETFTETWVQVGATWKMASIVTKSSSMKMDGKPMPMPPPAR